MPQGAKSNPMDIDPDRYVGAGRRARTSVWSFVQKDAAVVLFFGVFFCPGGGGGSRLGHFGRLFLPGAGENCGTRRMAGGGKSATPPGFSLATFRRIVAFVGLLIRGGLAALAPLYRAT